LIVEGQRLYVPRHSKVKVLVADDECAIADMPILILRKSGYEAHTAYSGLKQVELAKSLHPDFLISDAVKPAAIEVKKTGAALQNLLFTGQKATLQLMETCRTKFGRFADLILPQASPSAGYSGLASERRKPVPAECHDGLQWLGQHLSSNSRVAVTSVLLTMIQCLQSEVRP
jgi:CheY-like chemotaxis protein